MMRVAAASQIVRANRWHARAFVAAAIITLCACADNATSAFDRHTIVVTPAEVFVSACERVQLSASVLDARGQPESLTDVRWMSSDTTVAIVYGTGHVTGKATAHRITVTAISGSARGEAHVTVYPRNVGFYTTYFYPDGLTVGVGTAVQVTAVADVNDQAVPVDFTWESLTPEIATVTAHGLVRTLAPGIASIRATFVEPAFAMDTSVCPLRTFSSKTFIRVDR